MPGQGGGVYLTLADTLLNSFPKWVCLVTPTPSPGSCDCAHCCTVLPLWWGCRILSDSDWPRCVPDRKLGQPECACETSKGPNTRAPGSAALPPRSQKASLQSRERGRCRKRQEGSRVFRRRLRGLGAKLRWTPPPALHPVRDPSVQISYSLSLSPPPFASAL